MFERFTEKAIKVIMLAQEESRRLGYNSVGTEQILLGLIGEGTGIAAKTLKATGINLKAARCAGEDIIGRGTGSTAIEIPFTARAKHVLALSWIEAREFNHNYIGTEHLLLGLIAETACVANKVISNLGVDPQSLRMMCVENMKKLPSFQEYRPVTDKLEGITELLGDAALAFDKGNFEHAQQLYQRAVIILEKHYLEGHPETVLPREHLADTSIALKRYGDAIPIYVRLWLENQEQSGLKSKATHTILFKLAKAFKEMRMMREAESTYRLIVDNPLSDDPAFMAEVLESFANMLQRLRGRTGEARSLNEQARRLREDIS